MPSTISFSTPAVQKERSIYAPPQKKQKMSITQTYFLAHSARGKLSKEASRPDHDLRLLVGHANMLDQLMLDLANAEQEQERWFNKSVSGAREEEEASFAHQETIVEESEADWDADDAESTTSEDVEMEIKDNDAAITTIEIDTDMEEDDEEDEQLALVRTASRQHSPHSPPELTIDSDSSDSEDESMPLSPPLSLFTQKQRQAMVTTGYYDAKEPSLSPVESEDFEEEGFYLPSRQQPTIIAAY